MNETSEGPGQTVSVDGTDAVLLARARQGDDAALNALVGRHLGAVYDLSLRVLGEADLAEDAAQETWVLALRGLDGFRGDASFRTWVLRIAMNTARSALRRRGRRRETVLKDDLMEDGADPARAAVTRTEAERVAGALEALPPKQRMAVSLRIHQGLSYREVGEMLDCSEVSARVNYHHGIKRLRELLQ